MSQTKSFEISKQSVWEAWKRVKAKGGTGGIDGQSIEGFEERLQNNLYKIWNRMSSGSYMPPEVRVCEIPKGEGDIRTLGIPTVGDRVAQMVVKMELEPRVEPHFHPDSYGYRPGKSAHEALGIARQRCWKYNWVIDVDIQGYFDTINHELMMRAVRKYADERWILLYIERWLKAPARKENGEKIEREQGTPQGGVISPLLANIFLHHVFDEWMKTEYPSLPFERYADDILVHCYSEKQARYILENIRIRLERYGLRLHPEKTKIVYCKDDNRKDNFHQTKFDFLGYQFRPRLCRSQKDGRYFVGFTPAISPKAIKAIRATIRGWRITRRTPMELKEMAAWINPIIRGWLHYYGAYCKSALHGIRRQLEFTIAKWAMRKYKHLHRKFTATLRWLRHLAEKEPTLFAHWCY